jgi:SAM-dependent methyltransferase
MFQTYEQIFSQRADTYQKAMQLYPAARDLEFQFVVEITDIKAGEVICDAPSGGGYLSAYLPDGIERYLTVETAADFTGHCPMGEGDRIIQSPLDQIALESNSVDVCISLAGTHHLEDKSRFFREAARILKPGGRLLIADVAQASAVDRFLNQFVDQNSSMGHKGVFLDEHSADEISACGFEISSDKITDSPWSFNNRADMGIYSKMLFGIDLADEENVIKGIEDILGFIPGPGKVNMAWSLRCIVSKWR